MATVVAGLSLASVPAVADEWIVEPDDVPGPLMRKWRDVQQAQADRDACPRPTSWDDQAAVDVQAEHCDRRDALLADLVASIAAAAGTDLADPRWLGVERDSMDEVPGLAAVREGSALFTLTYGSGHGVADHYVELGQREHKGRSFPAGYFARPVVFESFCAEPAPAPAIPPERTEDAKLVVLVDHYLAAEEDFHSAAAAWDDSTEPEPCEGKSDLRRRYDEAGEVYEASTNRLIDHMMRCLPLVPLPPSGIYSKAAPVRRARVGRQVVAVYGAMTFCDWRSADPDSADWYEVQATRID